MIRHRRSDTKPVEIAARTVKKIPDRIGDWQGVEEKFDEQIVTVSGCADYKSYRYTNALTGRSVEFAVMAGPTGEMTEHVPEVCYPAANFTLSTRSIKLVSTVDLNEKSAEGELVRMDFRHPKRERAVRVWQGWFDGERWGRPQYPRFYYVWKPALFRVQLSTQLIETDALSEAGEGGEIDAVRDFLREALPVISEALTVDFSQR